MNELKIKIPNPIHNNSIISTPIKTRNQKTLQEYLKCLPYPIWIFLIIIFCIGILFALIYLVLYLSISK